MTEFALYAGINQSSISTSLEINITRPQAATTSRHDRKSHKAVHSPSRHATQDSTFTVIDFFSRNKKACELYLRSLNTPTCETLRPRRKVYTKMAPQYMPLPLLDNPYVAVKTTNTTFDSPDWKWSRSSNFLDGEYVPYICEAILVIIIFT